MRIVRCGFVRQPMLHVHTGFIPVRGHLKTMLPIQGVSLTPAGFSDLIFVNVRGRRVCKRASQPASSADVS